MFFIRTKYDIHGRYQDRASDHIHGIRYPVNPATPIGYNNRAQGMFKISSYMTLKLFQSLYTYQSVNTTKAISKLAYSLSNEERIVEQGPEHLCAVNDFTTWFLPQFRHRYHSMITQAMISFYETWFEPGKLTGLSFVYPHSTRSNIKDVTLVDEILGLTEEIDEIKATHAEASANLKLYLTTTSLSEDEIYQDELYQDRRFAIEDTFFKTLQYNR